MQYLLPENILQLAVFAKTLLNYMAVQNDTDPYICCKLLSLSESFFTDHGSRRKYLYTFLQGHKLWNSPELWIEAIEAAASAKREADKECLKRLETPRKRRGVVSAIKGIARKIPQVFQKDQDLLRTEKSSIYMIASQFNFHLMHMALPSDLAEHILLTVARRAQLDVERTCNLLAEFRANQASTHARPVSVYKPLEIEDIIKAALPFLPDSDH